MISWIIIVVLVIIGIFLLKVNHFRHKTWIIIIVFLALFLYATLYIVNTKNQLDFSSFSGFVKSMKVYGGWLANGFQNLKVLTGRAIKMDWASTNATLSDNKQIDEGVKTASKPKVMKIGEVRLAKSEKIS